MSTLQHQHAISASALFEAIRDGSFSKSVQTILKKVENKALTYWKTGALKRFRRAPLEFPGIWQQSRSKEVEYIRGFDMLSVYKAHFKMDAAYGMRHLLHMMAFVAARRGTQGLIFSVKQC